MTFHQEIFIVPIVYFQQHHLHSVSSIEVLWTTGCLAHTAFICSDDLFVKKPELPLLVPRISAHATATIKTDLIQPDIFYSNCTAYLFLNGSHSLCARLLRLQYFTLSSETQDIINMTCQTIEHNDLSLIPLARESLMFLL